MVSECKFKDSEMMKCCTILPITDVSNECKGDMYASFIRRNDCHWMLITLSWEN